MNPVNNNQTEKRLSFSQRVAVYIFCNYDIPEGMSFYHGVSELEFDDWIEECIDVLNENVIEPYGDDSDTSDVATVGDMILAEIITEYDGRWYDNDGRALYVEVFE